MSSGVEYVIVCEDLQSQVFIRRALIQRGANPRRIQLIDLPAETEDDDGAGEQYVREKYAKLVKAHRARAARMQAALVVHIDADPRNSVLDRHQQLAEALSTDGQAPRSVQERIAHLVPKRNIETWIHFYLDGPPVDEERKYPKYKDRQSECKPAAEAFSEDAAHHRSPPQAPPSLHHGLDEFRRVL